MVISLDRLGPADTNGGGVDAKHLDVGDMSDVSDVSFDDDDAAEA